MEEFLAYQFLATSVPSMQLDTSIDTLEKFQSLNDSDRPFCLIVAYNADTFEEFSRTYLLNTHAVVIRDGAVEQLYRTDRYVLDTSTMQPIEYYDFINLGFCLKRDAHTDKILQYNCVITYDSMPSPEKEEFSEFEHKSMIMTYGKKPYARILYCYTDRGYRHEISTDSAVKRKVANDEFWIAQISIDSAIGNLKAVLEPPPPPEPVPWLVQTHDELREWVKKAKQGAI